MSVLVELSVDWNQTNHGSLSSFNHGEPADGGPHDDKCNGGGDGGRERRLLGEDQAADDDAGEDEQDESVRLLDTVAGVSGMNSHVVLRFKLLVGR